MQDLTNLLNAISDADPQTMITLAAFLTVAYCVKVLATDSKNDQI